MKLSRVLGFDDHRAYIHLEFLGVYFLGGGISIESCRDNVDLNLRRFGFDPGPLMKSIIISKATVNYKGGIRTMRDDLRENNLTLTPHA